MANTPVGTIVLRFNESVDFDKAAEYVDSLVSAIIREYGGSVVDYVGGDAIGLSAVQKGE